MKNYNENKNEHENENNKTDEIEEIEEIDEAAEKQKRKEADNRQVMKALGLFTQLGLSMASCILGGFFLGLFLDKSIGTAPLFMIILLLAGIVAAIKLMYDISKDWK